MKKRFILTNIILLFVLGLLILWNIFNGSVKSMNQQVWQKVVYNIRLPRLLAAILLGGALSVSGFLLQTFFGNPIAGPYVLGISSGAKLFVAIVIIFLLSNGVKVSALGMVSAAFAGSLAAMGFVLLISLKVRNMSVLVVCGILIGYICSAITDFFITFASDTNIANLHNWALGSFSGMNWTDVRIIAVIVIVSVCAVFLLSKPIGAFQLGENYARNMGVNIKLLRVFLIFFSSLLSACVTAFAGPVSFVGIAVPHLIKSATGTSRPIIIIPTCFLGGAVVTLLCDGIARTLFAPTELSVSSVTAFLLAPVVIFMMINKQGQKR